MVKTQSKRELKASTKLEINNLNLARKKLVALKKHQLPIQYEEFLLLKQDIQFLLDALLISEIITLETSHLIRLKLTRICTYYQGIIGDKHIGQADNSFAREKETQDSKMHIVQLMLSQIFPKLKQAIIN